MTRLISILILIAFSLCAQVPKWGSGGGGGGSSNSGHAFGASFYSSDGTSALTAGRTVYMVMPFACTIAAWSVTADAGTATVDVWKVATGTAIPTVGNTITAAATPALSSGTSVRSTTLTGWTTAIAANDIIAVNLKVVATATFVNLTVECN